jgi:hypothetical protein
MDLRKDIYFFADLASFPVNGATGVLYVDKDTGFIYSWNGSTYLAAGTGGLNYLGTWNANTNSPTITSGVGSSGDYYIVGTPGTTSIDGISSWDIGDWVIFGGSAWQKIDNSETTGYVTSVGGTTPISSSGGTTPTISISQANGSTDGYLSSTDWTAFNSKVSSNIYTANGTVTGNRTIDLNGNTLRFSNGPVEFDQGTTNSGEIRLYEDSDFGSNRVTLRAAQSMSANTSFFFPPDNGTNGYVLSTNGSGSTSWIAPPSSSSGKFGIADSTGAYTFYTTLSAAITAASSGQTVEFFTDYTETGNVTINLKNGVNINGNGHTYTCTYGGINVFYNGLGVQSVSDLTIVGTGMNAGNIMFLVDGASCTTYCNGVVIKTDNGHGGYANAGAKLYGLVSRVSSSAFGITVANGSTLIDCKSYSVSQFAIYSINSSETRNCYAESTGNYAIYGGAIYNCIGIGGIQVQGTAYNSIGISSSGYGIYITGGSIYNCTAISSASWGIFLYSNNAIVSNCTIISTAANGIYSQFVSGCKISNNYITSSAAIAVRFNATSASFNNNHIDCTWNNTGGHAFQAGQSGDVLCGNVFQVANASANCLNAGSAVTTKYVDSKLIGATTPVNANITQGMVNTEDNFGNILI